MLLNYIKLGAFVLVVAASATAGYKYRDNAAKVELSQAIASERQRFADEVAQATTQHMKLENEIQLQDQYLSSVNKELTKALKKPAKQIVLTNEVVKYEDCNLDAVRLTPDVVRLLNDLREGKSD